MEKDAPQNALDDIKAHLIAHDSRFDKIEAEFEDLSVRLVGEFRSIDGRFAKVAQQFDQIDQRFAQVDQRFAQVDQRFAQVDQRFDQVDQRFDRLEDKIDSISEQIRTEVADQLGAHVAKLALNQYSEEFFDRLYEKYAARSDAKWLAYLQVVNEQRAAEWKAFHESMQTQSRRTDVVEATVESHGHRLEQLEAKTG